MYVYMPVGNWQEQRFSEIYTYTVHAVCHDTRRSCKSRKYELCLVDITIINFTLIENISKNPATSIKYETCPMLKYHLLHKTGSIEITEL